MRKWTRAATPMRRPGREKCGCWRESSAACRRSLSPSDGALRGSSSSAAGRRISRRRAEQVASKEANKRVVGVKLAVF